MLIFKRNTGDVAVQLLVFVVVQMMAKVMVTVLSITYCSIMIIRAILTMMRMVCFIPNHSNHVNGGCDTFQMFPMMMRMMRKRRIRYQTKMMILMTAVKPFRGSAHLLYATHWWLIWWFEQLMIWQARNISVNAAVSASFLEAKLVKRARNACTQGNMMRIKQTNMNLVSEKYLWQLQQHLPARFLLSKPLTFGGWRGGECCSVSFAHFFGRRAKIF